MTNFTPIPALIGGVLIGLAAALLWWTQGRTAGISGILGGVLPGRSGDRTWRLAFVAGLVSGGAALQLAWPEAMVNTLARSTPALAVAGLLVGFGTCLAGGCTSGHGVCGNARLEKASIAATLTFIGLGVVTVTVIGRALGGAL